MCVRPKSGCKKFNIEKKRQKGKREQDKNINLRTNGKIVN